MSGELKARVDADRIASREKSRGILWRVGEVAFVGLFLVGWTGLVEAIVLTQVLPVPDPLWHVRDAVLRYMVFGLLVGGLWGLLTEGIFGPRRGRRAVFHLISLFGLTLSFQLGIIFFLRWGVVEKTDIFSLRGLWVMAATLLLVLLLIGLADRISTRPGAKESMGPLLGVRTAGITLVPLLAAVLVPEVAVLSMAPPGPRTPNVLLVVMDTTRADRLSSYGYHQETTPALDRIAQEGARFARAYSSSPWTLPSHASIFTAEYPSVHQATRANPHLDDHVPTLAEHMNERGYNTVSFSKKGWINHESGLTRGFRHVYDLYEDLGTVLTSTLGSIARNIGLADLHTDKGARAINQTVLEWMDRRDGRPFFAFINYNEAHAKYSPPSPYRERYLGEFTNSVWGQSEHPDIPNYNAALIEYSADELAIFSDLYSAEVSYQDEQIGALFDQLRTRGILDETLVIITSDHGENFGDHELMGHGFCLYDSLLHVPLIVRFPGALDAGAVIEEQVENRLIWRLIDLVIDRSLEDGTVELNDAVATLSEGDGGGALLFSELRAGGGSRNFNTEFWRESPRMHQYQRDLKSIRQGNLKYVWSSDGNEELFDLAQDAHETKNIASERPQDVARLNALLSARVRNFDIQEVEKAPEFSDDLKERLKAMGYIH